MIYTIIEHNNQKVTIKREKYVEKTRNILRMFEYFCFMHKNVCSFGAKTISEAYGLLSDFIRHLRILCAGLVKTFDFRLPLDF